MSEKINHCEKCGGEGWLWSYELTRHLDDGSSLYLCNVCHGKEDPDMARDRELAENEGERMMSIQSDLTFRKLAETNKRRCEAKDGFNHKLNSWSSSDWITAVTGELGEAANIVKKLNRVRDGIPGNKESAEELRAALQKEIADVAIYLDLLAQSLGFRLEDAIVEKFNMTSEKIGSPERL